MKIKRLFKRLQFHSLKKVITISSYFSHRFYMQLYIPLLKKNGMNFQGTPRYIGANVQFDEIRLITLGDRVVISDECHFLTHDYSITTALIANGEIVKKDLAIIRGIAVGNNVFIGKKTIVMPNSKIGDNVIIGAGSVIRGKIDSNSIYAGNPAVKINSINSQMDKWKTLLESNNIRID